jgi:hypothetical protein
MINSMLNHVALLKPPLPQLNVELVSWYITKSCFGVVHNIELGGGGGETNIVLSMFNNFVIAGMVSRVLSKIVALAMDIVNRIRRLGNSMQT